MASSPTSPTGYLHELCRRGDVTAIRSYLQGIEDVNRLEERLGFLGHTPLHSATNHGQTNVVRLLLLYGANVNAKANGFYTPLHIAASMDNTDCVIELLRHKADITSKDEFDKTPYDTAVINRCKKSARILKTEEVKKAARENNPGLRDILSSISLTDVIPSCFREALLEASRGGHMEAICSLIITGGRHTFQLRNCILEALRFDFFEAAALLLTCYAAKHDKRGLLKYLISLEVNKEEEQKAMSELPQDELSLIHGSIERTRYFSSDEKNFIIAVPIGLALKQRKMDAVGILLSNTKCRKEKKEIEWAKLALGEIDPVWLENLTWVEKLNLSSNLLTRVPSNIHNLEKLCVLDLRNNQLKSVSVCLLEMPTLRDLKLSGNKIMELPGRCNWSPSIRSLYLSDNSLQTLPMCMAQAKLTLLQLAKNNLYEVPLCVCEIITLEFLDLSANPRLTQLPNQMGRLRNIRSLKLEHLDQLTDPPDRIKQDGVKTIMYLRNSLRTCQGYYTVKLMLVGRAEQGKTTLMHRLMRDYTYNTNSPTNGIDIDDFRYNRNAFGLFSNYPEYTFQVWDFGGQEDFYATHQCFLSTLALYLLVWNLEEGESGIEMLKSWLDTIFATTSNTSLIIVGTHLDKVRRNKEPGFPERMQQLVKELVELPKYKKGQINSVYIKVVSCALDNREGIDDLRTTIYDAASALKKTGLGQVSVMGEKIPHSFRLVADAILAKRQELHKIGRSPIMHKTEFEALVLDIIKNDPIDIEDANDLIDVTQFMHERGIVLHYDDPNQDLRDLYFLDPKWLCELMARIVTLREVNPYIVNGILDLSKLPLLLREDRFPHRNSPQFIRLLNRFQIACSLDDKRVLIPSKLPAEKPQAATNKDLPFITIKRIHSFPCIPNGFWSRLISRLLFYMKDMLLGGENVTRNESTSPFQLDPFCCRCPLVFDDLSAGGFVEGSCEMLRTTEASVSGSFENIFDSSAEFQGFRYYGIPRRGAYINGRFFGISDAEDRASRSDSGYEYSSDDDDDARGSLNHTLNATFPASSRLSKDNSWSNKGVFKHSTDPGTQREHRVADLECLTPCSDSALQDVSRRFERDDLISSLLFDPSDTKEEDSSNATASPVPRRFGIEQETSFPGNESEELLSTIKKADLQDLSVVTEGLGSPCTNLRDGGAAENELLLTHSDHEGTSQRLRKSHDFVNLQNPTTSESTTDSLPHESKEGLPAVPLGGGGITPSPDHREDDFFPRFERSHSDAETTDTDRSTSYDNTLDFSSSESVSSVKETSFDGFPNLEEQGTRSGETDENIEKEQLPQNQKENETDVSHTLDSTDAGHQEPSGPKDTPSVSCQCDQPMEIPKSLTSATPACELGGECNECSPHLPHCSFIGDFPIEKLPQLPTDLASLIDKRFLHCWKSGVCLRHPRLFLLLSSAPDPQDPERHLVITEVSPCQQGRRVLSYVVDHIDTIIREWFQELSTTDGYEPIVRQLIPCVVCERLGLEPHKFPFADCQQQSSKTDTICCPKHPRLQVNLHRVAPDIMLHDVDVDLLLSHDQISYEETEASILGSGGYGKVFRGQCRGQAVAIKIFTSDAIDPIRHYREVRKELNVLRRVRHHPYLISVVGVTLRPLCLVLELAERGALTDILQRSISINRIVLFRVAYQVAEALRFLHVLGVIYRDLKPENVLVWSLNELDDLHVKLIDFGTANFATSTGLVSVTGTPGIHAPEMLECANKEEYTPKVDVYSYGILLYKLITRLEPFQEYDSPPKINAAVIRGERPKWDQVPVAMFGLPTLTELMLLCWSSRPTVRPTTSQVAEQVRQPAFQCLLAKQPIPPKDASVRHVCVAPDSCDLWIACDGYDGNKIYIYDGRSLDLQFSFSIDTYQEQKCFFQIQGMHCVAAHMLIGVRGAFDLIFVYSVSSPCRHKFVTTIPFSEQLTCVTSNDEYIFVGLNNGTVRCILKSEMKKSDRKKNFRFFAVGRHRILSMIVVQDKLWVSASRYIYRYLTKPGEVGAFEVDAMWYAGPEGMEDNPQTQISLLKASFDQQSVLSVCRSVLGKWDVTGIKKHYSVDCASILRTLYDTSTEIFLEDNTNALACITCVEPTQDTLWVGTASGHVLIFDAFTGHLVTWFHSYDETRTLTLIHGPGPCGTEQNYVISTGKGLRPEGLGTKDVCVLSAERVRQPPREAPRMTTSSGSLPPKCIMIMWEVVSKECFARIEAKSGRQRFPVVDADKGGAEDHHSERSAEENP
ncbi:leucine-rich repeat serine/threonine-protein kinase 2-like isoform X1 [Montipora capricornis]|uniref:leucine-rich repeat serine/threonine-protein kinase 2-like isoform X1 n=2 Tax=Montipora capricornis TaxID=246305 RepID=UPI0035F17C76